MQQYPERDRPMEIDAILGSVVELSQFAGVATSICAIVLALGRERARLAGRFPE